MEIRKHNFITPKTARYFTMGELTEQTKLDWRLVVNWLNKLNLSLGWVCEGREIFDQDEAGHIADHEIR